MIRSNEMNKNVDFETDKNVEFTLTAGEFMRPAESLHTVLTNHREDDIGLVTIKLDYESTGGDPSLMVLVTEYDDNALEYPPLARYEVSCLLLREDLEPLVRTNSRPNVTGETQ
jgi:hypothetical protein